MKLFKVFLVALLLNFQQPAFAQFQPGVVLRAQDLNAALAAPTITGGSINGAPIGLTNPQAGAFTTLVTTSLTMNGNMAIGSSSWTQNRAAGTLPDGTGVQQPIGFNTTFTGNATSNSDIRNYAFTTTAQGSQPIGLMRAVNVNASYQAAATASSVTGMFAQIATGGTSGPITGGQAYQAFMALQSSATPVTHTTLSHVLIGPPTISAGNFVTTLTGVNVLNIGNANITTSIGLNIAEQTGSTNIRGIQSAISSGANKLNIFVSGTAASRFVGDIQAGRLIGSQGTTPTCTSNCGTSPSVAGSDSAMRITMGASGSPASGFVVTFGGSAWTTAPACIAQSALSSMVVGKMPISVQTTTTTATITTNGTAPANSDVYSMQCIGVAN